MCVENKVIHHFAHTEMIEEKAYIARFNRLHDAMDGNWIFFLDKLIKQEKSIAGMISSLKSRRKWTSSFQ